MTDYDIMKRMDEADSCGDVMCSQCPISTDNCGGEVRRRNTRRWLKEYEENTWTDLDVYDMVYNILDKAVYDIQYYNEGKEEWIDVSYVGSADTSKYRYRKHKKTVLEEAEAYVDALMNNGVGGLQVRKELINAFIAGRVDV